ncbi:hypothetical protein GGR57DRAFT_478581 [Xylariaceae sp. FL1272]|nr:hypothetical protein GGR57DRAFT_478581 [Xylariaceae sp. FL1272]
MKLQRNLISTRPMNHTSEDYESALESHQVESAEAPESLSKMNGLRVLNLGNTNLEHAEKERRNGNAEESNETHASAIRDEYRAMTYNLLSSIREDDNPPLNESAGGSSTHSANNETRPPEEPRSNNGSKRRSMLPIKAAPGGLYRHLSNRRSADVRPRQHNRSHSEAKTDSRHDPMSKIVPSKPRPQSMLPAPSTSFHQEEPDSLGTEEQLVDQNDLCITELITAPAVKKRSIDIT